MKSLVLSLILIIFPSPYFVQADESGLQVEDYETYGQAVRRTYLVPSQGLGVEVFIEVMSAFSTVEIYHSELNKYLESTYISRRAWVGLDAKNKATAIMADYQNDKRNLPDFLQTLLYQYGDIMIESVEDLRDVVDRKSVAALKPMSTLAVYDLSLRPVSGREYEKAVQFYYRIAVKQARAFSDISVFALSALKEINKGEEARATEYLEGFFRALDIVLNLKDEVSTSARRIVPRGESLRVLAAGISGLEVLSQRQLLALVERSLVQLEVHLEQMHRTYAEWQNKVAFAIEKVESNLPLTDAERERLLAEVEFLEAYESRQLAVRWASIMSSIQGWTQLVAVYSMMGRSSMRGDGEFYSEQKLTPELLKAWFVIENKLALLSYRELPSLMERVGEISRFYAIGESGRVWSETLFTQVKQELRMTTATEAAYSPEMRTSLASLSTYVDVMAMRTSPSVPQPLASVLREVSESLAGARRALSLPKVMVRSCRALFVL